MILTTPSTTARVLLICSSFFFKKDPSLVKYIPDVINGLYKYTKGTINAEEALEQYSDVVTDYYNSIEDFDALVTEFWDTNIHKDKAVLFPPEAG